MRNVGTLLRLTPATWEITRGQTIELHVDRLNNLREHSIAALAAKSDDWLQQSFMLPWLPLPSNNLWAWYHVMEDELNHRGQIRWLRQRLSPDI